MASLMDKLKALGIGVKSPEQQAREADPVLRKSFNRQIPTPEDYRISRAMRDRRAAAVMPSDTGPMEVAEPYTPQSFNPQVAGVQALSPMGLFTRPDTDNPDPFFGQLDNNVPEYIRRPENDQTQWAGPDAPEVVNPEANMVDPEQARLEEMRRQNDEGRAAAFQEIIVDPAQNLVDWVTAQRDKYKENYNMRQMQRGSQMVIDMENQLMRKMQERDREQRELLEDRKAANQLAALEDEVGRLNAEMDRRNLLLRESGLFGQGRSRPSYTNPMQPVTPGAEPYDPGLPFYSNPDYYAAQSQSALESAMSRRPDIYNENNPFSAPQYYNLSQYTAPVGREEFIEVNGNWVPYNK